MAQEPFILALWERSFMRMVSCCDLRPSEAREYREFRSSMMSICLLEESSGTSELTSNARSGRSSTSPLGTDWAPSANRSMLVQ